MGGDSSHISAVPSSAVKNRSSRPPCLNKSAAPTRDSSGSHCSAGKVTSNGVSPNAGVPDIVPMESLGTDGNGDVGWWSSYDPSRLDWTLSYYF